MPEVTIRQEVVQVVDGIAYEGALTFVGAEERTLLYRLNFEVSLAELDNLPKPGSREEIRQLIAIEIRRPDGSPIDLTDEMYGGFIQLIVPLVMVFHDLPRTRSLNAAFLGPEWQEDSRRLFVEAALRMTYTSTYNLLAEVVQGIEELTGFSLR